MAYRDPATAAAPVPPAGERLHELPAAERLALGRAGLRVFFAIAEAWQLPIATRRVLLGDIAESTYHKWRGGRVGEVGRDLLERLSLLLGIHKALVLLFGEGDTGLKWLQSPNTDATFAGRSPLERMGDGSIDDLYAVRRYLDAWRGGWP
ncbi:MAG: MbcA/ParS/Xre antitoxin family protein [Gemmatimonadaceae bacterium]|jgi:hypothetical protein|nr:MbcA/ParS/Xre antitoxin family protein [Gemmatimonadaceae bacterium]